MDCYVVGERGRGRKRAACLATVVERLGSVPDVWQARVLESGAKRGILNCTAVTWRNLALAG